MIKAFLASLLVLALVVISHGANPYRPLTTDAEVELPDTVKIPDFSKLELAHVTEFEMDNGDLVTTTFFYDSRYVYQNNKTKWEEYPYIEMIKIEPNRKGLQKVFCIGVAWIDPIDFTCNGYVELGGANKPATNKLTAKLDLSHIKITRILRGIKDGTTL